MFPRSTYTSGKPLLPPTHVKIKIRLLILVQCHLHDVDHCNSRSHFKFYLDAFLLCFTSSYRILDWYLFIFHIPVLWIRIWSRIRIRSDPKLFARSGSGINHFGSGSWQPLPWMNLKQNFSDKIYILSFKNTVKMNKTIFFYKKISLKSLSYKNISIVTDRYETLSGQFRGQKVLAPSKYPLKRPIM